MLKDKGDWERPVGRCSYVVARTNSRYKFYRVQTGNVMGEKKRFRRALRNMRWRKKPLNVFFFVVKISCNLSIIEACT